MTATIPYRFPARTADKAVYIMSTLFVQRIHLIVDFDGRLDRDRLARALRLCLDAEPILGCRFVPRWIRPYWSRLTRDELDATPLLVGEQDTESFLATEFDEEQSPQLRALLAPGERGDRLVLKVNHQVTDAGGVKELGYLLASVYRKLKDKPHYQPAPNLGSRSLRQVYGQFLPRRLFGILGRYFSILWNNLRPYKSMVHPSGAKRTGAPIYVFRQFSQRRVQALRVYAAQATATLNDLMVAAMLRALVRQVGWKKESALRLLGTVDLRRYLPEQRAQALCNLSSFYFVNLAYDLGDKFADTLARVKRRIDQLKSKYFGLGFVLGSYLSLLPYPFALKKIIARWFFRRTQKIQNAPSAMTNMGIIDDQALDFGSPRISAAMLATPASQPPIVASGLTGFRDSLTLSAGFYESAIPRAKMEELFEIVDRELPG